MEPLCVFNAQNAYFQKHSSTCRSVDWLYSFTGKQDQIFKIQHDYQGSGAVSQFMGRIRRLSNTFSLAGLRHFAVYHTAFLL